MGYYHIRLTEYTRKLCTIILPWGKYRYKHLSIGLINSPDIFQQELDNSFQGFEFIHVYIYELSILTKGYWTYYVQILELTLNQLKESQIEFNIKQSFYGKTEIEYLGFWVTCDGVKPINKKVEAIKI